MDKKDADEIVQIFRNILATGESYITPERAEFRIDRAITEYYEWRVDRILLPDGSFGVVCYFRNISEQVKGRLALKELDQRKDEFLANMSHEIRSPLTGIVGYADILLTRVKDSFDIHCLTTIKQSGNYHLIEPTPPTPAIWRHRFGSDNHQAAGEMLGGNISFDSELDKGSTFCVTIPTRTEQSATKNVDDAPRLHPRIQRCMFAGSNADRKRSLDSFEMTDSLSCCHSERMRGIFPLGYDEKISRKLHPYSGNYIRSSDTIGQATTSWNRAK